jgi:protein O-mannosyl-transferase
MNQAKRKPTRQEKVKATEPKAAAPKAPKGTKKSALGKMLGIAAALFALTYIVYQPAIENDWTNWDDPGYVFENELIIGQQPDKAKTFFKKETFVMGNYHPITMVSLLRDWEKFGDSPKDFHRMNVIYHALATVFVFLFFWKLSAGSSIISIFTALIFAIHPLHVESVAWIAARKDQIYTIFFFMSAWLYLHFREGKQKALYYVLCLAAFLLAMLGKAMAAPLPLVLILIDYYLDGKVEWKKQVNKLPFLLIAFVLGYWAIQAQKSSEALASDFSFFKQILFAGTSYLLYIVKFIAPTNISAFYPYPNIPDTQALPPLYYVAPLLSIALAVWVFLKAKGNRVLFFGLGFFTLNIALVLQVLAVGAAMMADRYTYIPYVGLAFIPAYYLQKAFAEKGHVMAKYKTALAGAMLLFVVIMTGVTRQRIPVWQDTKTLFTDVIEKYDYVAVAWNNRGKYYGFNEKNYEKAIEDLNMAIKVNAKYPNPFLNRGNVYGMMQQFDKAIQDFTTSVTIRPDFHDGWLNRAMTYSMMGQHEKALADYNQAITLKPDFFQSYFARGYNYFQMGNFQNSMADYYKCLSLNPAFGQGYYYRSMLYLNLGQTDNARKDAQAAMQYGFAVPDDHRKKLGL